MKKTTSTANSANKSNTKKATENKVFVPKKKDTKKKTNVNNMLRAKLKSKYYSTFKSANGIIKFCKTEGLTETQAIINDYNTKNKSNVKIGDLNLKSFLANLTPYERFKSDQIKDKDGKITYVRTDVKKTYFSTHQVSNVLSRLSKA